MHVRGGRTGGRVGKSLGKWEEVVRNLDKKRGGQIRWGREVAL